MLQAAEAQRPTIDQYCRWLQRRLRRSKQQNQTRPEASPLPQRVKGVAERDPAPVAGQLHSQGQPRWRAVQPPHEHADTHDGLGAVLVSRQPHPQPQPQPQLEPEPEPQPPQSQRWRRQQREIEQELGQQHAWTNRRAIEPELPGPEEVPRLVNSYRQDGVISDVAVDDQERPRLAGRPPSILSKPSDSTPSISTVDAAGTDLMDSGSGSTRPSTAMSARDRRLEDRLKARNTYIRSQKQQLQPKPVAVVAAANAKPSSQLQRLRAAQAQYQQPNAIGHGGGDSLHQSDEPAHAATLPNSGIAANGEVAAVPGHEGSRTGRIFGGGPPSGVAATTSIGSNAYHHDNYSARGRAGRGGAGALVQHEAAGVPSHPTERPQAADSERGGGSTHRRPTPHHMW
eukprot:COSAG05_NODE_1132_length_5773_cov_7.187346_2_plen_399_part_00